MIKILIIEKGDCLCTGWENTLLTYFSCYAEAYIKFEK